ncbi:hypothetical protein [Cetobacterium sp. ZOR0034]|uniref:hypothetical protein n=1 Tax=Cetobacterium sp. ZOR0034 TaxID=1339239 RepID=UPI000647EEBC|nr:hypothetical protein [Cetobacterium sp. ZOR0034]
MKKVKVLKQVFYKGDVYKKNSELILEKDEAIRLEILGAIEVLEELGNNENNSTDKNISNNKVEEITEGIEEVVKNNKGSRGKGKGRGKEIETE